MGSVIALEGCVFEHFTLGLTWVRDCFLFNKEFLSVMSAKIEAINPVHLMAHTNVLLGPYYRLCAVEHGITDVISWDKDSRHSTYRLKAFMWLGEHLSNEGNLKRLAEVGPVSIVIMDPKIDPDAEESYFQIRNWVGKDRHPNFDWSLGPTKGLYFTS